MDRKQTKEGKGLKNTPDDLGISHKAPLSKDPPPPNGNTLGTKSLTHEPSGDIQDPSYAPS
jgi:hypothetical protein